VNIASLVTYSLRKAELWRFCVSAVRLSRRCFSKDYGWFDVFRVYWCQNSKYF